MRRHFAFFVALSLILIFLVGCTETDDSAKESNNNHHNNEAATMGALNCEHTFSEDDWTISKESNCKAAGYKERKCQKCAYKEQQTLPKGEHSYLNGACSVCGLTVQSSKGLQFTSEYDKNKYSWSAYYVGMGECSDTVIIVPAKVWDNGVEMEIPVSGISNFASYSNNVTDITFLSPIMDMPEFFFSKQSSLQRVAFAEGQTTIWKGTFSGNTGICQVKLPTTLQTIGANAFSGTSLESIVVPGGVKVVEEKTFSNCKSLKDVVLSDGVLSISERAFENCTALERISVPASVNRIAGWAFYGCTGLTELDLRCDITAIPSLMCSGAKSLKTVTMGNKITIIGQGAFQNCVGLENVSLSDTLKTISKSAFSGCSALERLELPACLTKIQSGAFNYATKLSELVYAGTMEQWKQIELENGWKGDCPASVVRCVDGELPLI